MLGTETADAIIAQESYENPGHGQGKHWLAMVLGWQGQSDGAFPEPPQDAPRRGLNLVKEK